MVGLSPSSRILDVGCGAGALAIMLRDRIGRDGHYLGFDVDNGCIAWCTSHLQNDQFEFRHHDYRNETYRPGGRPGVRWPAEAESQDVVVLKSLFTHMLPPDVEFYVAELSRVLAVEGVALVTAFAYQSVDSPVVERFPHDGGGYRFARAGAPEAAVAYPTAWLLDVFRRNGLTTEFHAGYWRPQDIPILAYQDIILARRAPGTGVTTGRAGLDQPG